MADLDKTDCIINSIWEASNGRVYVSVSGVDSIVVLHRARELFGQDNIAGVFADTGLEFPEVRKFWKLHGAIFVRPQIRFDQVIKEYGYPLISKQVARYVSDVQNASDTNQATVKLRMTGIKRDGTKSTVSAIPKKWQFLVDAPFKLSDKCCYYTKEKPLDLYAKTSGRARLDGVRSDESNRRGMSKKKQGNNCFDKGKLLHASPILDWGKDDVWDYIREHDLDYPTIYDKGEVRTGCMFCCFGIMHDSIPNRFQRMRINHWNHWKYCMDRLKYKEILAYIGVRYR